MATVTANNTFKNTILDGIDATFNGATLTVRTGAAPGASNSATGTVLATVTLPADAFAAASSGTKAKSGTWEDTSADNTGTAAHFRIVGTGGEIIEGDITATGGGGAMTLDNTSLASGQDFLITAFTLGLSN